VLTSAAAAAAAGYTWKRVLSKHLADSCST
jgi:hypothetical protein